MLSQRVEFATSTMNGKIFGIGGTVWDERARRGKVLHTVEEYGTTGDIRKFRADMRIGSSNPANKLATTWATQ
jgi:hypothetical protein